MPKKNPHSPAPRAVVFGCEGLSLTSWEVDFFAAADPLGFILFARNCESPKQLRELTKALRDSIGRADAPVLIDQEGGRVARLGPPHWRTPPAAPRFGALALKDREGAITAVRLNARLIAAELFALGINADCAPVIDLLFAETHESIGGRIFSDDPALVATLGRAFCEGLQEGGVIPIIKHLPGYGRARVDSHHDLPIVDASLSELESTDFAPFRALQDAPWGMTAHVLHRAVDAERPATTSPRVIAEVIRGTIGFTGVLITDDLSMEALAGDLPTRARQALAAGCDIALHCNGKPGEMEAVAAACGPLSGAALDRLAAAQAGLGKPGEIDFAGLQQRLDALLDHA